VIAKLSQTMSATDQADPPEPEIQFSAWMLVVWPAFLLACLIELVVFAVLDPGMLIEVLQDQVGAIAWSRTTVYSLSFMGLWAAFMLSNALTLLLSNANGLSGHHQSLPTD
jgi:hypothetical protein